MSECKDCKYFDTSCNDCIKDDHYAYKDDKSCSEFEQRKECKHKYEKCDEKNRRDGRELQPSHIGTLQTDEGGHCCA